MAKIQVNKQDETTYRVSVSDDALTEHTVSVDPDYARRLLDGKAGVEDLVRASFRFLLEREPNTSILKSFDLQVINNYFPEYEQRVRDYL